MGRRQFGSIRKLSSGRYQARYQAPDGTSRLAPRTFSAKGDAARWLAGTETEMSRGSWIDPRTSYVDLRTYSEAWLRDRTVRGQPLALRTVDSYAHSLRAWILPTLGPLPLDKITPPVVRKWHSDIAAQTGRTATRQAYAVLRAILNTAVSDEIIPRNPCRIVGAGQPNSPERPLISLAEVQRLTAAMPEHLRTLVQLAFWSHARLGEALALTCGDVDLKAGTLRIVRQVVEIDGRGPVVTEPKVGSRRIVHLPAQGLEAAAEQLAHRGPALPAARLFTRPSGGELRAHDVHHAWGRARQRVDLPDVHFHDLRHAGLTLTAQAGATLAEVMRRAGHVSAAAALRYQHAADQRDAQVAAQLSRLADEHLQ